MQEAVELHLFERVECDLYASSGILLADLWRPVNVLKDKLDGVVLLSSPVDNISFLILDEGGSGGTERLQLHLTTHTNRKRRKDWCEYISSLPFGLSRVPEMSGVQYLWQVADVHLHITALTGSIEPLHVHIQRPGVRESMSVIIT